MFGRRKRIQALVATYDGPEAKRVRAAIVTLADGDESKLEGLLELARTDYRDVLWGEEQRRTGRIEPPMSPERERELIERFGRPKVPATSAAGPPTDLQLTGVGARSPELLKAIRAATGLGLADVAALVERAPVRVLAGVPRETAERVQAEIAAAGGAAEVG